MRDVAAKVNEAAVGAEAVLLELGLAAVPLANAEVDAGVEVGFGENFVLGVAVDPRAAVGRTEREGGDGRRGRDAGDHDVLVEVLVVHAEAERVVVISELRQGEDGAAADDLAAAGDADATEGVDVAVLVGALKHEGDPVE